MAPRPETYDAGSSLYSDEEKAMAGEVLDETPEARGARQAKEFLAKQAQPPKLITGNQVGDQAAAQQVLGMQPQQPMVQAPQMVSTVPEQEKLQAFVGQLAGKSAELTSGRKQLKEELDPIQKKQVRAQTDLAALQEQMAAEKSTIIAKHEKELSRIDAANAEADGMRRNAEQKALTYVRQAQTEARDLKVDPNRFWSKPNGEQDMGRKIMAAFSMALAGAGTAIAGRGENGAAQVLDIINTHIDRDIDAQKFNIQQKREDVAGEANQYQLLLAQNQNERVTESQLRVQLLERAKSQIETLAAEYESPMLQQQAAATIGKLEEQQLVETAKINQETIADEARITSQAAGVEQGRQQFELARTPDLSKMEPGSQAEAESLQFQGLGRGAPGTQKATEQAREQHSKLEDMSLNTRQLYAMVAGGEDPVTGEQHEGMGAEIWRSQGAAAASQIAKILAVKLKSKDFAELGVLSGHDAQLLDEIISEDPTGWRQGVVQAKLRSLIQNLETRDRVLLKPAGLFRLTGNNWGTPASGQQREQAESFTER